MAFTQVTDHTRRAILHLPPPHWGKPRIASCVRAITDEIQEFEDAMWSVIVDRYLDAADDARLAVLGRLVGEPDLGYSTETYRGLIRFRILLNKGKATIDDIIEIATLAGVNDVQWQDGGLSGSAPARLLLIFEDAASVSFPMMARIRDGAIAAGISADIIFVGVGADRGLRCDDASAVVTVSDPGLMGDASGTVDTSSAYPLWHLEVG